MPSRETYPPGATFELVVAAAALEEGLYASADQSTISPEPYTLPGTTTSVSNKSASGSCEDVDLTTAFRLSCDNVFAKTAVDLGWAKVKKMAEKFGFAGDDWALQLAMVSAVLANDGKLVSPHLVSKVTDSNDKVLPILDKPSTQQIVSPRTAAELRKAMNAAVTTGTSAAARVDGADSGGMTAITKVGGDQTDLCTAYARRGTGGQRVAVAVVVEESKDPGNHGGGAATPVARRAMEAAIARR